MTPEPPIEGGEEVRETPRPAYDVCQPDRLPADRVAFVDGINQQFLQSFGQELSVYLEIPVESRAAGLDQGPVSAFLDESAADACLMTFNLAPMNAQAWVGLSSGLLFRVLDILLGAPQSTTPATRTNITEIEQHVLREFFHKLVDTLNAAWTACAISFSLASIATPEDARQSVDAEATSLILKCAVKFGEAEETFRIAVPVLAVRLAALKMEQNAAAEAAGETATRAALVDVVGGATLNLEAVLGGSSIRLGDLAAMQPGQILVLSQPAGSQLECLVNGKAKYRGEWIAHGDRHGLQIDSLL